METLLNRYRNKAVLLLAILAQLVLLGYQVKGDGDVRFIRVWTITAVTPLARAIEGMRGGTVGVLENYIFLRDIRQENRLLQEDLAKLKLENQFLKSEMSTVERAKLLSVFQARSLSRTLAGRIFGTGAGDNSRLLFVDRGGLAGVQKGMAVVTPDGIVGKILAVFPTASQVMLITDPDFAAGVVSEKHQVKGTLKGQGQHNCRIDYIPAEEQVEVGELFFTSGDDRIFPRGFPAARVRVVRPGNPFKEVLVEPTGMKRGLEDVLILLETVHQPIPETHAEDSKVYLAPPVPGQPAGEAPKPTGSGTEADRLREKYKAVGEAQGHKFGEGLPGSKPPDFNLKPNPAAPVKPAPSTPPQ